MRKLITSAIVPGTSLPVKSGTLDHLQLSYQEGLAAIVKSLIGPSYLSTRLYRLWGCVETIDGGTGAYTLTAGAVFANDEIYLVDATSFTITLGRYFNIVTTLVTGTNADPVRFTDGVDRNIHQIRKAVALDVASGDYPGLWNFPSDAWTIEQRATFGATELFGFAGNTIILFGAAPPLTATLFLGAFRTPYAKIRLMFPLSVNTHFDISGTSSPVYFQEGDNNYIADTAALQIVEIEYLPAPLDRFFVTFKHTIM